MSLTRETVINIAELAKLQLTEAEIKLYAEQLSDILDYVDTLDGLNTDDIPPTASVLPIVNAFRDDIVRAGLPTEKALAAAPKAEANQFSVAAVLDTED